MEHVFAALVPNIHSELAGHMAVRFALRRHSRERVPDLLAGGVRVRKLYALLIGGECAVVNIEEIAGIMRGSAFCSSNPPVPRRLLNIGLSGRINPGTPHFRLAFRCSA